MVLSVGTIQYSKRPHCFVDLSRDIVNSLNGNVLVSIIQRVAYYTKLTPNTAETNPM